jgi:hypothetical protein
LVAPHASPEVEIDEYQIGVEAELLGDLERLLTVSRDPDGKAVLVAQQRGDGRECVRIVLDDENS